MTKCSFNSGEKCMAIAVNIGGPHQMCDTFMSWDNKAGTGDSTGLVGACRVPNCAFNKNLQCLAKNIQVGPHADHPDCSTFKVK
jgi:hypothetical protein